MERLASEGGSLAENCLEVFLAREKVHVWRYEIAGRRICPLKGLESYCVFDKPLENVPESWLDQGSIHPSSREELLRFFSQLRAGEQNVGCTVLSAQASGGYLWVRISGKAFPPGGAPAYAVCVSNEVPGLVDADKRFFQEEQMRSMLSEDVIAASKVNLSTARVEYVWGRQVEPQTLARVETFEQMYEVGMRSILTEDDRKRYQELFSYPALLRAYDMGTDHLSMEYRYRMPDGRIIWAVMNASMVRDSWSNELEYYSFIRDIDEKKQIELMLREKAQRDEVTGLYNKSTTESMIRETLRNSQDKTGQCAMVMVDLDGFKYINNYYGHPYGDEALAEAGRILSHVFGSRAVKGRVGGDEFAIFLSPIPSEEWVRQKAQEFCGEMRQFVSPEQGSFRLTGSVGIAFSAVGKATFEQLYEQADTALYEAKRGGKDRYAVYHDQVRIQEPCDRTFCLAKDFLSKNCMLDELEDMAFVIDAESYDLLYMNRAAMETLGIYNCTGRKCYEVLQGFSEPCLFCGQHLPEEKTYHVWENTNAKLRRSYVVKDRFVNWNGRRARFELYLDVGPLKAGDGGDVAARILFDSLGILHAGGTEEEAFQRVLQGIGAFYGAQRTHILEVDRGRGTARLLYEWRADGCRDGGPGEIDLKALPRWERSLESGEPLIVRHGADPKENSPAECELMASRGVESLYGVPFRGFELVSGFVSVDDPTRHLEEITLLESLTYLVGLELSRRRNWARREYVSSHDPLTGLLNHNSYVAFTQRLQPDAVSAMGVLTADVNGLRNFNRELGAAMGDELLSSVGSVLRENFGGDAAYRLAGDEFLVLCQNMTNEVFREKAERTRELLERLGPGFVSIGYAWADMDIELERLHRHAEERMQIAKRQVRKSGDGYRRDYLAAGLTTAIREGCFLLYLQPKVRCATGYVQGAEALVRYRDAQHGVVPPAKFVPALEEEQMIHMVDFFLLEELCRTMRDWKERGYEQFPISLNFSRSTLLQEGLIDRMNEISGRYGIAPELLEIEITESFSELELDTLREIGGAIVENGYRLSLDDFGAKYSNLSVLSALKLDVLKLDKSLVNNLYSDSRVRIVIKNLLAICRELGIESVAEGVETREQLDALREMQCDFLQGYLLNKPIPAADFAYRYLSCANRKKQPFRLEE